MPMSDRWRPNFNAEFRREIESFLERHEEVPYSDAREFVESVVKNKIMDIETKNMDVKEEARKMIREDLELD